MSHYLFPFAAGMAYEWACVFWVHSSERGNALATGLIGAVVAVCQITGLIDAIRGFWPAFSLVIGYGVGSGTAVIIKERMKRHRRSQS